MARAEAFHEQGDIAAGVIELRNVLQNNPQNAEARWRLGLLRLEQRRPEDALSHLRRADELGWRAPDRDRDIQFARGLIMLGAYEEAVEILELPGGKSNQTQVDGLLLRGRAHIELGQLDAADADMRRAHALDDGRADVIVGMGRVALLQGRVDDVYGLLERALILDPEATAAWQLLGQLEQAQGRLDEAETAFTKVMEHADSIHAGSYQRALVRLARRDLAGARADTEILRRDAPRAAPTLYLKGLTELYAGDAAAAAAHFIDATNRDPEFLPAMFYAGIAHHAHGNWEQAERWLRRFLDRRPDSVVAQRMLAETQLRTGSVGDAERLLAGLMERGPGDVETLDLMAGLYLAQGRDTDALPYLQEMADTLPESPQARARLATALHATGERERSRAELEAARELAPETADELTVTLIQRYLEAGAYQQALDEARDLAMRHPDAATPHALAGAALLGLQRPEDAVAELEAALEKDPGHYLAARNLAVLAAADGRLDDARRYLETALDHRPEDLDLLLEVANFEANHGDLERSRELVERAVQAHPEVLRPRLVLAGIHVNTGDAREALRVLEPMKQRHGDQPAFLDLLAEGQLKSGRTEQAIDTLHRLADTRPESADAYYRLGLAQRQAERPNRARQALEQAIALDPEHWPAIKALAALALMQGDIDRALALADRLTQHEPEQVNANLIKADAFEQQGSSVRAEASLQAAYEMRPSGAVAVRRFELLRSMDRTERGFRVLENHLERYPGDDRARIAAGDGYLQAGDYAMASHHLARAADDHPENYIVLNNLAYAQYMAGSETALETARRAHSLRPEDPRIQHTFALALLKDGQGDAAIPLLEQARAQLPGSAAVELGYGKALMAVGRRDDAVRVLNGLVADGPLSAEAREAQHLLQGLDEG